MNTGAPSSSPSSGGLLPVFLVVAALYFAKEVCILLALSVLLAFLLEPLARRLERLRLGRIGSAVAAVLIALTVFGAVAEVVAGQLGDFGNKLPDYQKAIHEKVRKLQAGNSGVFGRAAQSIHEFHKDLTPSKSPPSTNGIAGKAGESSEAPPVPVEVRNPETTPLQFISAILGPLVNVMATLVLVTIICIFILASRDDLQSRLLRIVGARNKQLTNQVLGEISARVSRYLRMQLIVNASFGVPVGLGLWGIGIPNPVLWGILAALLRYIPYAGAWIAAAMPVLIAWATASGWAKPLLVLGLFGAMELLTANFIEPWLYGNSTGITPLAVLLAAVFWTWVWGAPGLLLSVPLTVCLVSIARYVPQLDLVEQLFGQTGDKSPH